MLGGVIGSSVSCAIASPDAAPSGGVLVVLGRARWDDQVVAVVAAGQEHADERLVVDPLRERVDQAEALHSGDECGRPERVADARVGGLQEKLPARDVHGYLST